MQRKKNCRETCPNVSKKSKCEREGKRENQRIGIKVEGIKTAERKQCRKARALL